MRRIVMRSILSTIALCFLFTLSLLGQVKYSNEFLTIGAGARIMGMGGAGTAFVDDYSAGYWNPAGMMNMDGKFDVGLMHSEYFAGLAKYDFAAAAYRLDPQSAVGLSMIRFAVDDIPNTLELIDADGNIRYDRITSFSTADLGFLASYARKTHIPGLTIGGTVKIINRHTGDFAKAWGFGLDAAASYFLSGWNFSAVIRDVTGTFNAWSFDQGLLREAFELSGNELPENSLEITLPRAILAASRKFNINEKIKIVPAVDLHLTFDGRRHVLLPVGPVGIDPFIGAELRYNDWLFVRTGAGGFQWVPGLDGNSNLNLRPALGLGIQYRNFYIDYAINGFSDIALAGYSNLISLRYRLQ
jgi:hypothetical protein